MSLESLKERVCREIEGAEAELVAMARRLYENPEIMFQERKTVALLGEVLGKLPHVKVETGVGGIETGFKATLDFGIPGPTVAMITDLDALPEIGHACGHNLIITAAAGSLIGIVRAGQPVPGKILYVGAPAEEGGGGKVIMLQNGGFDGIDCAYLLHPLDEAAIGVRLLSAIPITIEFHGKPAHASTDPDKGINALNAVLQTFHAVDSLRQHVPRGTRIHGIIRHGGTAVNIVPAFASCEFLVRAEIKAEALAIAEQVRNCARGAALATGARVEFPTSGRHILDPMKRNDVLVEVLRRNMEAAGISGVQTHMPPTGASNDLANVSQALPVVEGCYPIGPKGLTPHTEEFREATMSEAGRRGLLASAKAQAMAALDLVHNPDLVAQAKAEFASRA